MTRPLGVHRAGPAAMAFIVLVSLFVPRLERGAIAQTGVPAELGQFVDAGADVSILASAVFGESPNGNEAFGLSRVVPGPASEPVIVVAGGPELWYAEAGTITLTGDAGVVQTISAGTQAVVENAGQYAVQFTGADCPSALRLELSAAFAMRISTDDAAPSLSPDGVACASGGVLFEGVDALADRTVPALGFIARVTWPAESFVAGSALSGPIGYAVESGTLRIAQPDAIELSLGPGSWATFAGGELHSSAAPGTKPVTALVAGALLTDIAPPTPIPTPTVAVGVNGQQYVSPSYGYRLSWDNAWSVAGESTSLGSDTLQLSNGVSNVYFQSFGAFTGDALDCIDSVAANLPNQTGFSDIEPRLAADGKETRGGDAHRGFAAFDFTYTTESGSSGYSQYIECRVIRPGESVLIVTQVVLTTDYAGQVGALGALLKSLEIPAS